MKICAVIALAVALAAGCGRIGFDATGDGAVTLPPPTAYYPFDTDPTAGVPDATGAHAGTCGATCPTQTPAVSGTGYVFTGGELIDAPFDPAFGVARGITAALWVKPDAVSSCVVSMPSADGDAWQLCLASTNLLVEACSGVDGIDSCASGGALLPQVWRQLVIEVDATTLRLWIGGSLEVDTVGRLTAGIAGLVIGGDRDLGVPKSQFSGTLDELRIWDRVLTDDERALVIAP